MSGAVACDSGMFALNAAGCPPTGGSAGGTATGGRIGGGTGGGDWLMTVSLGDAKSKSGAAFDDEGIVTRAPHLGQRPSWPANSGRTCNTARHEPHSTRSSVAIHSTSARDGEQ